MAVNEYILKKYEKLLSLANCVKKENTDEFMKYWNEQLAIHRGYWMGLKENDTPTSQSQPAPQSLTSGQQGIEIPQTDKSASADRIPVKPNGGI